MSKDRVLQIKKVRIQVKEKIALAGPEYSESDWDGKSCFKICRTKTRVKQSA